jgi:hypothetical protein
MLKTGGGDQILAADLAKVRRSVPGESALSALTDHLLSLFGRHLAIVVHPRHLFLVSDA